MDLYPKQEKQYTKGRRRPIGYICSRPDGPDLYVVGHYEQPCGGCDTILGLEAIYDEVFYAVEALDMDVMFEGLVVCSDVKRCISLKEMSRLLVVELDTTLDDCIQNLEDRRYIRGDDRPIDPKHTIAKMDQLVPQRKKFEDAGVDFRLLDYKWALQDIMDFLDLKVSE